ncbi:unnamed protein product, partial [Prorocentrum cordatum]
LHPVVVLLPLRSSLLLSASLLPSILPPLSLPPLPPRAPTKCLQSSSAVQEGLAYEAIVAAMNSDGWGAASDVSLPVTIGVPKIREKPPAPGPPKLVALDKGRFKVSWSIPQACPPVEASQVQLADLGTGKKWLVEAATGRLVASGKTTFTATRLEATVSNAEDGVEYVAAVCCRNAEGFGEYSIDSDSAMNAANRSGSGMELVLAVGAPTSEVPALKPLGEGRMQVKWVLPEEAKA